MDKQETLALEAVPEAPRVGRDELNLAEFPFAVLSSRGAKNVPLTLEFKDGAKEWSINGHPKYGLPTATDIAVYVVLMELTREQDFPVQVQFSRHEVIRRLKWDNHGESYDRLMLSLNRLVGMTVNTKNAWFDASKRSWVRQQAFHILEAFDITDSRQARADEPTLFPSWIRWSPELYRNIQSGYIKTLDVNLFLSLRSAISQALYRYLDAKRYDGKPVYRIGLKKLAWEHLGLSRNYFPSQIKRKLDGAHKELMETGFLAGAEYAPMKSGDEMVLYRFPPRAGLPQSPQPELPASELVADLMAAGASRQAAYELAATNSEECRLQLEYLPFREARDPGAVLVKSIREGWSAPPDYLKAQTKQQRAEKARKKAAETASATATAAAEKTSAEEAFDAWWERQSKKKRTDWTAAAEAQLRTENRTLAELGAKQPQSKIYHEALRSVLKQVSNYRGGSDE